MVPERRLWLVGSFGRSGQQQWVGGAIRDQVVAESMGQVFVFQPFCLAPRLWDSVGPLQGPPPLGSPPHWVGEGPSSTHGYLLLGVPFPFPVSLPRGGPSGQARPSCRQLRGWRRFWGCPGLLVCRPAPCQGSCLAGWQAVLPPSDLHGPEAALLS